MISPAPALRPGLIAPSLMMYPKDSKEKVKSDGLREAGDTREWEEGNKGGEVKWVCLATAIQIRLEVPVSKRPRATTKCIIDGAVFAHLDSE